MPKQTAALALLRPMILRRNVEQLSWLYPRYAGQAQGKCDISPSRFPFSTVATRHLIELLIERPGRRGVTTARCQGAYLEHAHPLIECDRHDVAASNLAACRPDPCAVDSHMTGTGERRRTATRAHNPCVPQPPIDALPIIRQGATPQRRSLALAS